MFTGLVEAVATVRAKEADEGGVVFTLSSPVSSELAEGESLAVDGACLTVLDAAEGTFRVEAVRTTLGRTTLGDYREGRRVNLERALRPDQRLGGHLVQGHVDAVGEVEEVEPAGETVFLRIRLPAEVARVTIPHGSIAVDGVSLTVNRLLEGRGEGPVAEVAIIPYTWERTALDRLSPGDRVNLEADLMGKYVEKLLRPYVNGVLGTAPEAGDGGTDAT